MKAPYFPFYPGDYLADTIGLSCCEHGVYLLLLAVSWQRGPLPDDMDHLARLAANPPIEALRYILENYWSRTEQGWINARMEVERTKLEAKSSKAKQAALKRWDGNANAMRTHSERNANQNQNQNQNQKHSHNHNHNQIHEEEILSTESCRAAAPTSPKKLPPMEDVEKILEHLNARTGQNFRARNHKREPTKNAQSVRERLAEYDMETCLRVIDKKVADWQGGEMEQYLRPGTLFRREKFEQYAGQAAQPQRQYGDFLNDDDGNTGNVFEGNWSKA